MDEVVVVLGCDFIELCEVNVLCEGDCIIIGVFLV